MSIQHLAWAFEADAGDAMSRWILVCLANRADRETGQCWPSLKRIAADASANISTIKRKLNSLEERGLIARQTREREDKSATSTLYTLNAPNLLPNLQGGRRTVRQGQRTVDPHEPVRETGDRVSPYSKVNLSLSPKGEENILFEEFWAMYPRKAGKGQARRAYSAAIKKEVHAEIIRAALKYADLSKTKDKQYIAMPASWLNGERWLDEEEDQGNWGGLNLDSI